jgi:hypothetical protein
MQKKDFRINLLGDDWRFLKKTSEDETDQINLIFTSNNDLIRRLENKYVDEKINELMIKEIHFELKDNRRKIKVNFEKHPQPPLNSKPTHTRDKLNIKANDKSINNDIAKTRGRRKNFLNIRKLNAPENKDKDKDKDQSNTFSTRNSIDDKSRFLKDQIKVFIYKNTRYDHYMKNNLNILIN